MTVAANLLIATFEAVINWRNQVFKQISSEPSKNRRFFGFGFKSGAEAKSPDQKSFKAIPDFSCLDYFASFLSNPEHFAANVNRHSGQFQDLNGRILK